MKIKDELFLIGARVQDIIDTPKLNEETEKDLRILLENIERIRKDAYVIEHEEKNTKRNSTTATNN